MVDAPVTAIASPMLAEARAEAGSAHVEPLWCAYWDQSDEQGPYYLHDRAADAWYRVQLEGPYEAPPPSVERPRRESLRLERGTGNRPRVRLVGRLPRSRGPISPYRLS
jgi:hypothetical protein